MNLAVASRERERKENERERERKREREREKKRERVEGREGGLHRVQEDWKSARGGDFSTSSIRCNAVKVLRSAEFAYP